MGTPQSTVTTAQTSGGYVCPGKIGIIYDLFMVLVRIKKTFGNYILTPEIVLPKIIK
jgi:hypothetical protein